MNVLVVGGGAREHVLAEACAASPLAQRVLCAPGNAGIAGVATCVPVPATDLDGLLQLARDEEIGLVVVGPEDPLAAGLADRLLDLGFPVFGPRKGAAVIESSKAWAKAFMVRHGIPTGDYRQFGQLGEACRYIEARPGPYVIKADGLAAGKGVVVTPHPGAALEALERIMGHRELGNAGSTVIIEEFLDGEELSVLAITDGDSIVVAPAAQDHKRVYDGDQGPNTGGMGAYSPVPVYSDALADSIRQKVIEPALSGLAREGRKYTGVLYAGLILTSQGVKVLEFNARFGDPETQVVLPRYEGDVLELLLAAARGHLHQVRPAWSPAARACVVMASSGYPGSYQTGRLITGIDDAAATGASLYHAGTARRDGALVTAGGRVLSVVGHGRDLPQAVRHAYTAVKRIWFEGAHYRRDIAARAGARWEDCSS
ncbi:MAG: phosphoribosylamine--glycine ligase [Bacillota bacterium]